MCFGDNFIEERTITTDNYGHLMLSKDQEIYCGIHFELSMLQQLQTQLQNLLGNPNY